MSSGESVRNGDKSFAKFMEVLNLIASAGSGLSGRDITERSGMAKSTVFRMLKYMTDCGLLINLGGCYILGPALVRLGNLAREHNPLLHVARPFLEKLAAATRETVHLAIFRGGRICYADKVEGTRSVRMRSLTGSFAPAYCTGVGKAILAFQHPAVFRKFLEEVPLDSLTAATITDPAKLEQAVGNIRRLGYAVDNCEHEEGVFCIAAPIIDYTGYAIAAVSVSGAEAYLRKRVRETAAAVMKTAGSISEFFSKY